MGKQGRGSHTAWWNFIQQALDARGWSGADFQRASGIDRSRLVAWRDSGALPSVDLSRKVAEALGAPLLEVLVAAEILTPEEARSSAASPADPVRSLPSHQLLAEIERRLASAEERLTREQAESNPGRYEIVDDEVDRAMVRGGLTKLAESDAQSQ